MSELENIWNDFKLEKQTDDLNESLKNKIYSCSSCNSKNLQFDNYEIICFDCGLIIDEDRIISSQTFELYRNY